jgi:death-on-curing protein
MTVNEPLFLEWDDVLAIQYQLVELFGGSHGLRDAGLLESALEMPRSGFGGDYFHKTIFEMASAYLYHVAKNHPFLDGNKRIALACAHTFLQVNGWALNASQNELYELVLRVAAGEITDKQEIALFFEKNGMVVE